MDFHAMFSLIFPVLCIATVISGCKLFFSIKIVGLLKEINAKLSKENDQE